MIDSNELLRRAAELTAQSGRESDPEIRERLLRMAQHYEHIAEHETWWAAHPASIASISATLVPDRK
jgi:hypothetical protein